MRLRSAKARGEGLLFANVISEVCNSILGVAYELRFRLRAVIFFAFDVGQT